MKASTHVANMILDFIPSRDRHKLYADLSELAERVERATEDELTKRWGAPADTPELFY